VYYKEPSIQQYVVQIANGPAVEDDHRYAARVLATVLGDDSGSRMFWELIDTGLAECAALGSYEFQGTGLFMTYLSCSPEDTLENLDTVRRIFQQAEREGVTEEELQQAKSKILSHLVLQSERPSNRLFSVGNNWLQHRHYRTVRQTMDLYQRVTQDDVQAVLERYHFGQHTTVTVGPLTEIDGIPAIPLPAP
jgi:predicted Zn-dependent peptidase